MNGDSVALQRAPSIEYVCCTQELCNAQKCTDTAFPLFASFYIATSNATHSTFTALDQDDATYILPLANPGAEDSAVGETQISAF